MRSAGKRKLIWVTAYDPTALFVADANGIVEDDAVLLASEDWKVVNLSASEKATLLRVVLYDLHAPWMGNDPALPLTRVPSMARVLYTCDDDTNSPSISPRNTAFGTFIDTTDVLQCGLTAAPSIINGTGAAASPHLVGLDSDNGAVLMDVRVKRKLETDEEVRYYRNYDIGLPLPTGSSGFSGCLLSRCLVAID